MSVTYEIQELERGRWWRREAHVSLRRARRAYRVYQQAAPQNRFRLVRLQTTLRKQVLWP